MNKKTGAGIAFLCVGIALMVVFRNSTVVGMSSGIVFIVLGIVTMLRNRNRAN